jgi:hypothetical protein
VDAFKQPRMPQAYKVWGASELWCRQVGLHGGVEGCAAAQCRIASAACGGGARGTHVALAGLGESQPCIGLALGARHQGRRACHGHARWKARRCCCMRAEAVLGLGPRWGRPRGSGHLKRGSRVQQGVVLEGEAGGGPLRRCRAARCALRRRVGLLKVELGGEHGTKWDRARSCEGGVQVKLAGRGGVDAGHGRGLEAQLAQRNAQPA